MTMDFGQSTKEAFLKGFVKRLMAKAHSAPRATKLPRKGMKLPADKVPKSFAESIDTKDAERAWKGYRSQATESGGGVESLLMYPAQLAAEKILGRERVRGGLWKYVSGPALKADTAAGNFLSRTPLIGKRLFRVKEKIPWRGRLHREIERSSALGPLTKARDIAAPLAIGVGLEKGMKQLTKSAPQSSESSSRDQHLREKVASVMLQLHQKNREHEKRAHAERVFWKQVERGIEQPPESYSELQLKLASLVKEDLKVLEKAVELAGGQLKLGELDQSRDAQQAVNPSEKFLADLLD